MDIDSANNYPNINKISLKRIIKDLKQVQEYSSSNSNIYYKHDEDNILLGYALIIGNSNTPYQYGNLMFKFTFPDNYPFSPPKVSFLSNDTLCRYHPNLYKNGTCCLSILNTWRGEQWTSCQNILSILLTLSSILQINPLILEPGIKINNPDVDKFNKIIYFKNIDFLIKDILKITLDSNTTFTSYKISNELMNAISLFKTEIIENFNKNHRAIKEYLNSECSDILTHKISCNIYGLNFIINYTTLINDFNKIEI